MILLSWSILSKLLRLDQVHVASWCNIDSRWLSNRRFQLVIRWVFLHVHAAYPKAYIFIRNVQIILLPFQSCTHVLLHVLIQRRAIWQPYVIVTCLYYLFSEDSWRRIHYVVVILLRWLLIRRWRALLHVFSNCAVHADYGGVVLVKYFAWVCCMNLKTTQTFKCTPQCWVILKRCLVHFNGFSAFELPFINLAE